MSESQPAAATVTTRTELREIYREPSRPAVAKEIDHDRSGLPPVACMLRDHYGLPDMDTAAVERRLEDSYALTMWLPGGDTPRITGDDPAPYG